jgi:hypothetical protein
LSIRADILDNLETALKAIQDDTGYDTPIAEVSRFDENALTAEQHRFPLVMIVDAGPESLVVQDDTHYHYLMDIVLIGFVKSGTIQDLQTDLNNLISTLKQFIDSDPSLGSNVMRFRFTGLDSNAYNAYETKTEKIGSTVIGTQIRYWCEAGGF